MTEDRESDQKSQNVTQIDRKGQKLTKSVNPLLTGDETLPVKVRALANAGLFLAEILTELSASMKDFKELQEKSESDSCRVLSQAFADAEMLALAYWEKLGRLAATKQIEVDARLYTLIVQARLPAYAPKRETIDTKKLIVESSIDNSHLDKIARAYLQQQESSGDNS